MHSPTTAVPWELWRRRRWVLIASVVWFFAVVGFCQTLVDGVFFGMTLAEPKHVIIFLQIVAIGPLLCSLAPLLLYGSDADIAGKESTFPSWWFIFPLRTRAIVGWPMLYGTVAIAIGWLVVAKFSLHPCGIEVPLWWPSMFLASSVAWVQAIMWSPFGLPGLRVVVTALPMSVLVLIFGLCLSFSLPEPVVALLLGSTILPAYAVAVAGVARARRGDQPDYRRVVNAIRTVANCFLLRGKHFATPSRAQTWFEWRRNGLSLPIVTGLIALFLVLLSIVANYGLHHARISLPTSQLALLIAPLLGALSCGAGWGNCGVSRHGYVMPVFLATRPMSCAALIWAKMKAAAISLAIAWGITLTLIGLLFLFMGPWNELIQQWNSLFEDLSFAQKVVWPILIALLLPLATWRITISNLYLLMTGRSWVVTPIVLAMGGSVVLAILFLSWCCANSEYGYKLLSAVPWVLRSAALIKILLGAWLIKILVQRRLVPVRIIQRLLIVWILAAIGLSGLFCWLIPRSLVFWDLIVVGVVLALPLVRISLAPLALAWNRHR